MIQGNMAADAPGNQIVAYNMTCHSGGTLNTYIGLFCRSRIF